MEGMARAIVNCCGKGGHATTAADAIADAEEANSQLEGEAATFFWREWYYR